MKINRKRIGGAVAVVAAGAVAAAVSMPSAQAQTTASGFTPKIEKIAVNSLTATGLTKTEALHRLAIQKDSKTLGSKLIDRLGGQSANFYLDRTGHAVVNVLNPAAAQQVRASGATAKLVKYNSAELEGVKTRFDSAGGVKNTSWSVDPSTNKVVVTISDAAPKAGAAKLASLARSFGDRVTVRHSTGVMSPHVAGGDAVQANVSGGTIRCSAGFNGTQGGQDVIVIAGHCTADKPTWDAGPSLESNFPGTDYGLIENDSGDAPAAVDKYDGSTQPIDGPADATVGEQVCKSGSTTQVTCGSVSALNATVNYQEGEVDGMIQTDVHSEAGDSGGSLFDGSSAVGMVSGGDDTTTFFQPIGPALQAYGVTLK